MRFFAGGLLVALVLVSAPAVAQEPDLRDLLQAPATLAVHDGAKLGDWLERTTTARGLTTKQRTTITGEREGVWVVEQTGPAWQGLVLELQVDKRLQKVIEAKAAPAGKRGDLRGIKIALEGERTLEHPEGTEDIVVEAGAFKCRRHTIEQKGMATFRSFRFVIEEGPLRSETAKEVTQVYDGRAWHETILYLISAKDVALDLSGKSWPCRKIVRRATIDGVKQPDSTEWISAKTLFFGERLLKLETQGVSTSIAVGNGGKSVLDNPPPPEPRPEPKPEAPKEPAPPKKAEPPKNEGKVDPTRPTEVPPPPPAPGTPEAPAPAPEKKGDGREPDR